MDGWFLPFQLSACWKPYLAAVQTHKGCCNTACLTPAHNALTLTPPRTVIMGVGPNETLYIEGHGKPRFDLIYKDSPRNVEIPGPPNEFIDAFRLARVLKTYGFRGGNIRLYVCNSAEANSFGSYLKKAMDAYGFPYSSIGGRIGEARFEDMHPFEGSAAAYTLIT